MSFIRPFIRVLHTGRCRSFHLNASRTTDRFRLHHSLLWGVATAGIAYLALASKTIYLDTDVPVTVAKEINDDDSVVDPATSIAFPKTLRIPSKVHLPPVSLIGVGVRTVSFLGIKVYSVGFYADLNNPNLKIRKDMLSEEKIEHIIRNTSCVIRIVPTRSTSFTHLRDAFMRALQGRLTLGKQRGTVTEEDAIEVASPMRKLKSLLPNSPLAKRTPFDIYLSSPSPGRPRALIFRDFGTVENTWVATEFILHYFEGEGPSPPLKKSVIEFVEIMEK